MPTVAFTTRERFENLLQESAAFHTLEPEQQFEMKRRLMTLTEDQMEALCLLLEEEKRRTADLEAKLEEADSRIAQLIMKVKRAGMELNTAFLTVQEKEESRREREETARLLQELEQ